MSFQLCQISDAHEAWTTCDCSAHVAAFSAGARVTFVGPYSYIEHQTPGVNCGLQGAGPRGGEICREAEPLVQHAANGEAAPRGRRCAPQTCLIFPSNLLDVAEAHTAAQHDGTSAGSRHLERLSSGIKAETPVALRLAPSTRFHQDSVLVRNHEHHTSTASALLRYDDACL